MTESNEIEAKNRASLKTLTPPKTACMKKCNKETKNPIFHHE